MEDNSKFPRTALINLSHANNNPFVYTAIYVDMEMKNGWHCRDLRIPIPDDVSWEIQKDSYGFGGLPRRKFELEFKDHKDNVNQLRFEMAFKLDQSEGENISFPRDVEITRLECDDRTIKINNARLEVSLVLGRQLVGNDGYTNGDFIRTMHVREVPFRHR